MSHGWTPERRVRQAKLIQRWRPWARSTGPKTETGKKRVSRNGFKGGRWKQERELIKDLHRLLREQRKVHE